jgi:hypothetical protein
LFAGLWVSGYLNVAALFFNLDWNGLARLVQEFRQPEYPVFAMVKKLLNRTEWNRRRRGIGAWPPFFLLYFNQFESGYWRKNEIQTT